MPASITASHTHPHTQSQISRQKLLRCRLRWSKAEGGSGSYSYLSKCHYQPLEIFNFLLKCQIRVIFQPPPPSPHPSLPLGMKFNSVRIDDWWLLAVNGRKMVEYIAKCNEILVANWQSAQELTKSWLKPWPAPLRQREKSAAFLSLDGSTAWTCEQTGYPLMERMLPDLRFVDSSCSPSPPTLLLLL